MASLEQAFEPGNASTHRRRAWETCLAGETDAHVEAARRGDGDAFIDLFMAHERRLRLLAFGVLRDSDLIDDALQETCAGAAHPATAGGGRRGRPATRIRPAVGSGNGYTEIFRTSNGGAKWTRLAKVAS